MKNQSGATFKGGTIEKEDLDLSTFGLYDKRDSRVPEEDYFLTEFTMLGKQLWARHSEEGEKWFISRQKQPKIEKQATTKRKRTKK